MRTDQSTNLKLRVFVSSVQKELDEERMELRVLLSSDPFLQRYTVPRLFEKYPAPNTPTMEWGGLPEYLAEVLNERQRAILELAISSGSVTNRQVRDKFDVVRDTAYRDLSLLCKLDLLQQVGVGRAMRYIPKIHED